MLSTEGTCSFIIDSLQKMNLDKKSLQIKVKGCDFILNPENTAYRKTVLQWQTYFAIDLGYKIVEGNTEVVGEIWCDCRNLVPRTFTLA